MKNKSFSAVLDRLTVRHGVHQVFSDFLTLLTCALSKGRQEKKYLDTINKYEKPDAYAFSEALGYLVNEMTGPHGDGLIDVLGRYYEQNVSHGKNGQFFTPENVCQLAARINLPDKPGGRILDPACGSGRLLMAMAKFDRNARFYGADIDQNCAMMAAVNLCLNGMFGEIAWMDSLNNKYFGGWEITPSINGIPYLKAIPHINSFIYMRLPKEQKTVHPVQAKSVFVL